MKTYIPKILGKPSDYWVCKECNGLNWYENEVCTGQNQGCECEGLKTTPTNSMEQEQEELAVLKWIEDEINFYRNLENANNLFCEDECEFDEDSLDDIEIFI